MNFLEIEEVSVVESYYMGEPHSHDFYELYFLLDGKRDFFVKNKMFVISKNTLVIVPPFVMHKTEGGQFKRINMSLRK